MQNDTAAIADRALAMELAKCPCCEGTQWIILEHPSEGLHPEGKWPCYVCDGTGRKGGSTAQTGLDGLKLVMRSLMTWNSPRDPGTHQMLNMTIDYIADTIAKMCGGE